MTTSLLALSLAESTPTTARKKRVLLVDTSRRKRELRSEIMRKLGMEVDCAADIDEARARWRADLYDLVLISMRHGVDQRDRFCEDMRRATPPQQLAFLVGKPEYLSDLPNPDGEFAFQEEKIDGDLDTVMGVAFPTDLDNPPQFWGIMEASRRISAARRALHARLQAVQNLPAPPRDSEGRPSKRSSTSILMKEPISEEM